MLHPWSKLLILLYLQTFVYCVLAFPFDYDPGFDIQAVVSLSTELAEHSWEYGTESHALLELYDLQLTVFGDLVFPIPQDAIPPNLPSPSQSQGKNYEFRNGDTNEPGRIEGLAYAASKIEFGEGANALADGDGASADAASLGVAAILLGKRHEEYRVAVRKMVEAVVEDTPRFENGAISHRFKEVQAWSDFIFMGPPFLAFYAADTSNTTLLYEAYRQCQIYRQLLLHNITSTSKTSVTVHNHTRTTTETKTTSDGLWKHIVVADEDADDHHRVQGQPEGDAGLWSTGNGWAAAGMTRVLATITKTRVAQSQPWYQEAVENLTEWVKEILDGAISSSAASQPQTTGGSDRNMTSLQSEGFGDGVPPSPLLRNYLDDTSSPTYSKPHSFPEISGSSLLASSAFRMAVLNSSVFMEHYTDWAEGILLTLAEKNELGFTAHVKGDGAVVPAVNPYDWRDVRPVVDGSPEGQSFVVMLYAAWRDWWRVVEEKGGSEGDGDGDEEGEDEEQGGFDDLEDQEILADFGFGGGDESESDGDQQRVLLAL